MHTRTRTWWAWHTGTNKRPSMSMGALLYLSRIVCCVFVWGCWVVGSFIGIVGRCRDCRIVQCCLMTPLHKVFFNTTHLVIDVA